jgi:hypothetical protein
MTETLQAELRDYSWKYFSYHADQRLKSFNFFLLFLTAAIAGLLSHSEHLENPGFWIGGGFSLLILTFLFWKLDRRHRTLIHIAEDALRVLESSMNFEQSTDLDKLNIFIAAARETEKQRSSSRLYFTCTRCFNFIFLIVGIPAAAVFIIGLARLLLGSAQ